MILKKDHIYIYNDFTSILYGHIIGQSYSILIVIVYTCVYTITIIVVWYVFVICSTIDSIYMMIVS